MARAVRRLCIAAWLLCGVNLLALLAWARVHPAIPEVEIPTPRHLAIIAAHQDDDVLMAGGLALATIAAGGTVDILWATEPRDARARMIRHHEAIAAWTVAGLDTGRLHFLGFPSRLTASDAPALRETVARRLRSLGPDLVVLPTAEHGHSDHDLLAIVGAAAARDARTARVLHAVEYNPYLIAERAPQKVLAFLVRLAPGLPFSQPNVGVDSRQVYRLKMSPERLFLKRAMLEAFVSQRNVIPVKHFGYPDTFERVTDVAPTPGTPVIRIGEKRLSPWTVLTLAVLAAALLLLGAVAAVRTEPVRALLVSISLIVVVSSLGAAGLPVVEEDLLLVIPSIVGAALASVTVLLRQVFR